MIGDIGKPPTSETSALCALVHAKPAFVAIRGKADLLQYVCNMQADETITTAKLQIGDIDVIMEKFIVDADVKLAAWVEHKAVSC